MEKSNYIDISSSQTSKVKMSYKTDLNKSVLLENFEERNWNDADEDENWNFFWASVNSIRKIFNGMSGIKLQDNQVLNHFPTWFELCRKDHLAKNMKKYKKSFLKEGKSIEHLDFLPQTYILPGDMSVFLEEFKRNPNIVWILKPSNRSQGSGVVLVNKLSKVKKLNFEKRIINDNNQSVTITDSYVISRYIDNPLLIGGKKFDMRIYVLVTSYHPLKVWLFKYGFCRFCNEKFSNDVSDIDNIYIHLTNVAIQKKYVKYNDYHGGKWPLKNLSTWVELNYGYDKMTLMWTEIKNLFINSLKAVQNAMCSDKHCFELYGFDVLIDSNLKPWLIEVNASPSLCTTTIKDKLLKKKLISDLVEIVISEKWVDEKGKPGTSSCNKTIEGDFEIIYDESIGKEPRRNKLNTYKDNYYQISSKKKA